MRSISVTERDPERLDVIVPVPGEPQGNPDRLDVGVSGEHLSTAAWQIPSMSDSDQSTGFEDVLRLWSGDGGKGRGQITWYNAKVVATASLVGSALSFGSGATWFGAFLQGPDELERPPVGYTAWEACNCTLRPDVTALGELIPPKNVVALAAYPRMLLNSLQLSIMYNLLFRSSCRCWAWAAAPVQLAIDAVLVIMVLSEDTSTRHNDTRDKVGSVGHFVLFIATLCLLRPVCDGDQRPSCWQGMLVAIGLFMGVFSRILLFFLIDTGLLQHVNPGVLYMLALILHRTLDIGLRFLVKFMNVSSLFCGLLMLHLQIQGSTVLRSYAMTLESTDVALIGAMQCTLEVACSLMGLLLLSWRYNTALRQQQPQKALRLVTLFIQGIHADMVGEHLALSASLAQALFLDSRLVTTTFRGSRTTALPTWATMLAFELLADTVVLVILLGRVKLEARPQYPSGKRCALPLLYFLISAVSVNFPHRVNFQGLSCLDVC